MRRKRKFYSKCFLKVLAISMGIGYLIVGSNLIGKAMQIIASVDSGLLPGLGLVLASAGVLAWLAGLIGR